MKQKEDYKLGRMILNNLDMESAILSMARLFNKLKCCRCGLEKMANLLDENANSVFQVYPLEGEKSTLAKKRREILPLNFGNATTILSRNMVVYRQTNALATEVSTNGSENLSGHETVKTTFSLPGTCN